MNWIFHPNASRAVQRNLIRIDQSVQSDPEAVAWMIDMICSTKTPGKALARMNDAGVLGKFIPEFARVVAQMQHDLYHIYTVDEHTVRAIGILRMIEDGGFGR